MPIPKVFHQTWKTEHIPPEYASYVAKLKAMHPGWDYQLWTDQAARDFTAAHYPDFLSVYDSMPRNIMRADVIRYLILKQVGGFYLDLDYEVYRPFDDLVADNRLILPKSRDETEERMNGHWRLGNAILGSEPQHPFWNHIIQDLVNNPPSLERVGPQPDVEALTGPLFVTRVAQACGLADGVDGVWLAPREQFHGCLPTHPGKDGSRPGQNAYGVHFCSGTWRPKQAAPGLIRRILNRLRRLLNPPKPRK